jgi:hypothetical protein
MEIGDQVAAKKAMQQSSTIRAVWFKGSIPPAHVRDQFRGVWGALAALIPREAFGDRQVSLRATLKEPTPHGLTKDTVVSLVTQWARNGGTLDLGFEFSPGGIIWMNRPRPLTQSISLPFLGLSEDQVDVRGLLRTLQQSFRPRVAKALATAEPDSLAEDEDV